MFNGGNADFSMPVMPAYGNNGGNGGFGDGGWGCWIWVILIFAIFGWGNGGWGGFGGNGAGMQGALTRGDLCSEFSFNDLQSGVRNVNDAVNVGFSNLNSTICHQQYDTAQLINGVQMQMANEFRGTDNAVCNLGYQTQQGFNQTNIALMQGQNALQTQISDCCCGVQRAIDGVNYNMATNTCAITNQINNSTRDIIDSQNAGTRAILDYLCQEKISTLQSENQALRLAASQADQNNFIAANQQAQTAELIRRLGADCPQPAYVVQPPQAVSFPLGCNGQLNVFGNNGYGYNNGCGCNSGCCGCNA